ncbi:apolipoprotein N-acyltransferase [Nocardioides sp. TF02-7]|uniref:apolipoprotein N-acyltransferase n=1 Tax=Nocardioides sp. TF02-7 TaxID=2917724 RepID=UPI001F059639|nr:apolipoprotein N-acyltransferase [Nocardioides sp. TF02-7]UMG92250.1 apolipoprotein N-acyltransferase [Nocardioides sp. TF02-7]
MAGLACAAAGAPLELRWLLPLGVGAVVCALHRVDAWRGGILGYAFGLGYTLALVAWMRVIGFDAWLLVSAVVASYYALLGAGVALLTRLPGWPLWVAAWWVAVETAMSAWPLGGFPWTRLAWSTLDTPFATWLPWVGASGVSFLVVVCGAALGALLVTERRRAAVRAVAVVAAGLALPAVVQPASMGQGWQEGVPTAGVAAVQGDVPGEGNDVVAVHREVTRNHVDATIDLARRVERGEADKPDFVVWPENSTAVDPFKDSDTTTGIDAAAAAIGVPVLVGAIVDGDRPDEVLNQGLVWDPDGSVGERYTKHHPVPFGEYVPFRDQLAGLQIGRLDMVPRDMVPGTRTEPLDISGVRVADLICFDVAYDDSLIGQVRNGAQMISVQTSNASFTGTAQLEQQFAITRLRALETGRAVVVASTNGISGVIGPDGQVVERLPLRTTAVALASVPLVERQTLATRYGAMIRTGLCLVGAGAVLAGALLARSRCAGGAR